jgi:hypothetical protein
MRAKTEVNSGASPAKLLTTPAGIGTALSSKGDATWWTNETQKTACHTSPWSKTGPKQREAAGFPLTNVSQANLRSTASISMEQSYLKKRLREPRGYSNPNLILVNKDGRKPFGQTDEDATPVQSGQPRWMNEMEEHITRLSTNDARSAHGAATTNA